MHLKSTVANAYCYFDNSCMLTFAQEAALYGQATTFTAADSTSGTLGSTGISVNLLIVAVVAVLGTLVLIGGAVVITRRIRRRRQQDIAPEIAERLGDLINQSHNMAYGNPEASQYDHHDGAAGGDMDGQGAGEAPDDGAADAPVAGAGAAAGAGAGAVWAGGQANNAVVRGKGRRESGPLAIPSATIGENVGLSDVGNMYNELDLPDMADGRELP